MRGLSRKEGIFLAVLFLLALGVRLIYLIQLRGSPLFESPIMDARYHDQWALAIRNGLPFLQGPYFRAPLYPYFLAAIYSLFGHSYLAARMVQFLIGSLSVLLIYFLGKRAFSATVGRVAAVLAAFYGLFIYFEGELLIPALIVFLDLALLLALLSAQDRPGWWRWLGCGAILGLSAIARPNVLLFGVVLVPWLVLRWRRGGLNLRRYGAYLGSYALGVVLLIMPVTVRNYLVGKDFAPIASQGGVNFFIGNNRDSDGVTAIVPGTRASWWGGYHDALKLAEDAEGRPLKASEVSNYWFRRGLEFMRDEPWASLRLMFKKLVIFWGGPEVSNNKDIYFFSQGTSLLRILIWQWRGRFFCPFGIVAPLALAGMVLAWRNREGKGGLMVLFIFTYMVSVVLFFVNARFRLPVIPFLLPFAAYSLVSLFRERRLVRAILPVGLILVFGLAINLNLVGYPFPSFATSYSQLGGVYLEKAMYDQAEAEFHRALSVNPHHVLSIAGLAQVYHDTNDIDKAIEMWEKAISLSPNAMQPQFQLGPGRYWLHYQLGLSYYTIGRVNDAIAQWKEAQRLQPELPQSYLQLGNAYQDKGQYEEAIAAFEQAIQVNPRYGIAHYNLGHLYEKLGRIDEAMKQYKKTIEVNPNFAAAYNSLAGLYSQESINLDEAIQLVKKALELDESVGTYWNTLAELWIKKGEVDKATETLMAPGSIYLEKKMYEQAAVEFRRILSIDPHHVHAMVGLAKVYGETNQLDKAIELWEKAVSLEPDRMELHFHLGFCYNAKGRLDDAIAQWKEAVRLQPEMVQPYLQLGNAYEDKGQYQEAISAFKEAIHLNPRYVLALYNLGHLYKKLGRTDEAMEHFKQAIEINPNFADAYNSLGWLYSQEDINLDEGIQLVKKALELDETNGAYWDTLAELYIKKGKLERAREIFRRMIQQEPEEPFWRERLHLVGE
jgi:tetratricopeptide (TPR) repeat protein